jgi:hypothetical protein
VCFCVQLNLVAQQHWTFADKTVGMRFSPVSAHIVTVHKEGYLRIFASAEVASTEYVQALDISAKVFSILDEGLTSFAFDPAYDGSTNMFGKSLRRFYLRLLR